MKTYIVHTISDKITVYNCDNRDEAINKVIDYGYSQDEILSIGISYE